MNPSKHIASNKIDRITAHVSYWRWRGCTQYTFHGSILSFVLVENYNKFSHNNQWSDLECSKICSKNKNHTHSTYFFINFTKNLYLQFNNAPSGLKQLVVKWQPCSCSTVRDTSWGNMMPRCFMAPSPSGLWLKSSLASALRIIQRINNTTHVIHTNFPH